MCNWIAKDDTWIAKRCKSVVLQHVLNKPGCEPDCTRMRFLRSLLSKAFFAELPPVLKAFFAELPIVRPPPTMRVMLMPLRRAAAGFSTIVFFLTCGGFFCFAVFASCAI